jgi:hypothetical protein
MAKIAGIFTDNGAVVPGLVLEFSATTNNHHSSASKITTVTTQEDGSYSVDLPVGKYNVSFVMTGFTYLLGEISVTPDSPDGTLDEFIYASLHPAKDSDVTASQVTIGAGTLDDAINYLTPAMYVDKYPTVSEALAALCTAARESGQSIDARGFSATLDSNLEIRDVTWVGGQLNGSSKVTLAGDCIVSGLTLNGVWALHGGGNVKLSGLRFTGQKSTAAFLIRDLPVPSTIDVDDCEFEKCKYGILQQGSDIKMTRGRLTNLAFRDLTGDPIEMNLVNGHYLDGGLLVENIDIYGVNNTDGSPNWGIGIGIAGHGPYALDLPDDRYASNITVRNINVYGTRQCVHFEMCRNFTVENVNVNPDPSVSVDAQLTLAGVVAYGCRDFTIDGVRGESADGQPRRMVYLAWGVNDGNQYAAPCRNFTISNVQTETGIVEIATSSTNDYGNEFALRNIQAYRIQHRGLGSKMTFNNLRCGTFDAIGNYLPSDGEGGGILTRSARIEAEVINVVSVDEHGGRSGSFSKLQCDKLVTSGCNFDVVQSTGAGAARGYLLGNVGNQFTLSGDTFPPGIEFSMNDILHKASGGMFRITKSGALISSNDTIKAAPAGQTYIESAGTRNWGATSNKTAGTRILIPGGGEQGADLVTTITRSPYGVNSVYRIDITPALSSAIEDGTVISAAFPVEYVEV